VGETQNQPFQLSFNPCRAFKVKGKKDHKPSGKISPEEMIHLASGV
jgi:hypothetical protein